MDFPQYKEWMGETNRISINHVKGVYEFVKYASKNLKSEKIPCPCTHCINGKYKSLEVVELHLLKWGICQDYIIWTYHGEKVVPYVPEELPGADRVTEPQGVEVVHDSPTHRPLTDLIDDAYGLHNQQNHQPMDTNNVHYDQVNEQIDAELLGDREYIRLKADAARPLYKDCDEDHSVLYAMIGLHNLKSQFGLSGNSVTGILKWVKEILPKENMLPDNYPTMKKSLKGLGLKYKSIHACKYDCILYRNEHEEKDECPVCSEPRYMVCENGNDKHAKNRKCSQVPQKVLKYFPLGPRLKRFFTVPWIAEAMTWHARCEVGGNLMRHPVDSLIWQISNAQHHEFAKEPRNVRLAISTDGFNPFGNLSTSQSYWPVLMAPLSLPPTLCMRKEFTLLSLLIPGPKAPSDDIDIFLAPLIEELKELWDKGVTAFDSHKGEEFTLKAMVMWAIHDLPAYGTLSGCNVHGYYGCPICGEETEACWLKHSGKLSYTGHRRFLPTSHPFRNDKSNFLPVGHERRTAPSRLSGQQIEEKAVAATAGNRYVGKHPQFVNLKRKAREDPNDPSKAKPWSRRSIFFDLPYWKDHRVRHIIDVMHTEKNVAEHLIGTCLGGSHSKDGERARRDLQDMKIKKRLWLKNDPTTGRISIPPTAFTLTTSEKKILLDTLFNLKTPTGYSGNLRRVVNYQANDLKQCKSHDWHVIIQLIPLLFRHCFSEHKDLRRAIMQISLCFTLLCAKVVNRRHIKAAKSTLAEAVCVLEKYFPPSFFDISIHLLVHLCDEALLCGPVRYRWMYPFERLMKTFKDYVKNTRYIGGSIAEEYVTVESSLYAREHMPEQEVRRFNPRGERVIEEPDEFEDELSFGNPKEVKLTNLQYEQATRHVFESQDEVQDWREKYENEIIQNQRRNWTTTDFRAWVSKELLKRGDVSSRLARLAKGPSFRAKEFKKFRTNGFDFISYPYEEKLLTQNSGISISALTTCIASKSDKNPKNTVLTYYGIIQQILELDYLDFTETVFYCDWVKVEDTTNACKVDPDSKLIMVDLSKLKTKDRIVDEPFICAFQNVKKVFYSKCINDGNWSIVVHAPKGMTTEVDALKAPKEFQSALDDNPNLKDLLVDLEED